MRFILILLLTIGIAMAKEKDSCYSVQLTSFVFKSASEYNFEDEGYPQSCKLISFSKMNAVRCGCFEKYNDAKGQEKLFKSTYADSKVVTTYKYRFAPKFSLVNEHSKIYSKPVTKSQLKKLSLIKKHKEAIKYSKQNSVLMAEKIAIEEKIPDRIKDDLFQIEYKTAIEQSKEDKDTDVLTSIVPEKEAYDYMDDVNMQGHIDLTTQAYLSKPSDKQTNNYTASYELEMAYNKDNIQAFAKVKAQQDYYDIKGGSYSTDRSFIRLDELYAKYDFEDDQIMFGKNIRFWGALEVRNITDNFNLTDLRADPFETDKLGSWNAKYTHYTDSGEFAMIVKFYEQDRKMSAYPYVYYYFPQTVLPPANIPLQYSKKLHTEKSEFRPSVYLKYSGSTDTQYPLDYSIILENGYDSQRYYTQTLSADATSVISNENAYLVNKALSYNTLVLGPTLLKLEAVYADVIDNDVISDYYHIGLGVEHTLTQIYKESDLGLIAEYYRYETLEDEKRDDLQLFELFQNDLFLGLRYSFNEGNDASIVGGVILDLDYDEQVYYLEYEGRIADMFKINFDYRYIVPSQDYSTAFNLMGKHQRISLKMGYFF